MIIDLPGLKIKSANRMSRSWKPHYFGYVKPMRETVGMAVRCRVRVPLSPPLKITLTRIAPRRVDDDNLVMGMKPVRDGVADGLGLKNDSEASGLEWIYEQQAGLCKEYGLRVEVEKARLN